jgi:transposase
MARTVVSEEEFRRVFEKNGENRMRTAKEFGVSAPTILHWARKYGYTAVRPRGRPYPHLRSS